MLKNRTRFINLIIKFFTSFINNEYFSDITKDKSCSFIFMGQAVGFCMEAVHEALWQGYISVRCLRISRDCGTCL